MLGPDDPVQIEDNVRGIWNNAYETTVNTLADNLTIQIIEIGTLLVIFWVVKFALRFVTVLTDIVAKIPILKQFDELRRNYIWINTGNTSCIYNTCSNVLVRTNGR